MGQCDTVAVDMTTELLSAKIYEALSLMTELMRDVSSHSSASPLDELFETLRDAEDAHARAESEDLIWALWCSHEDGNAHKTMQKAIGALARQDFETSRTLLDQLVVSWPNWAEAWNKRATVYFLEGKYVESVADIERTLTLEPRHFGAASGLAQICLKVGDEHSALVAFDYVLAVNPNLTAVRETADFLRSTIGITLH